MTGDILADVRLMLRQLLRAPGYVLACAATIGLAIGANNAVFSTVYAVLIKPVRQADRLVVIWLTNPARKLPVIEVTYRTFQRWSSTSRSLAQGAPWARRRRRSCSRVEANRRDSRSLR